tara:strand:- start:151 stop:447 length:297 start_codon:yes stop_codon:yes gene_type:complete
MQQYYRYCWKGSQMKIYKIIDKEDENNRQVGEMFSRRQTAEKAMQRMMDMHCHKIAIQINKLTGIKRGANVQKFNALVKSIADPRFVIEIVEVNDSWR